MTKQPVHPSREQARNIARERGITFAEARRLQAEELAAAGKTPAEVAEAMGFGAQRRR